MLTKPVRGRPNARSREQAERSEDREDMHQPPTDVHSHRASTRSTSNSSHRPDKLPEFPTPSAILRSFRPHTSCIRYIDSRQQQTITFDRLSTFSAAPCAPIPASPSTASVLNDLDARIVLGELTVWNAIPGPSSAKAPTRDFCARHALSGSTRHLPPPPRGSAHESTVDLSR